MTTRLEPGEQAPDFTLTDDTGQDRQPRRLRGPQGHRLLLPGRDDARAAPRRRATSATRIDSLQAGRLRGASASRQDKPAKLAKFRERDHLTIPLLSDEDRASTTAYGACGEKKLYGKTVEGVIRSTFVVDEEGKVVRRVLQRQGDRSRGQAARDLGLAD